MLGRFLNLVCLLYFDSIKFAGLGNGANFTDRKESYCHLSFLRAKKTVFSVLFVDVDKEDSKGFELL